MGAFSSKSPSFLVRNQSSYCFRIIVPKDIRETVGKTVLRYSLQTGAQGEAKYKSRRLAGSVQRLSRQLKGEEDKMAQLTREQINDLLQDYLIEALEESETGKVVTKRPIDPDELDEQLFSLWYLEDEAQEELALVDYRSVSQYVDDLLAERGIEVEKDSETYGILCREMLKVHMRLLEIEQKRAVGDYSDELGRTFAQEIPERKSSQKQKKGPRVSKVIDAYREEQMSTGRWTEKSENEIMYTLKLFTEFVVSVSLCSCLAIDLVSFSFSMVKYLDYKEKHFLKKVFEFP